MLVMNLSLVNLYDMLFWTPLYWGYSLFIPLYYSTVQTSHLHGVETLILGLSSVAMGQMVTIGYYVIYNKYYWKKYCICALEQLLYHPEGLALMGVYLALYWASGYMPSSYYTTNGGIYWNHVLSQLLLQDFLQFVVHYIEHKNSYLYRKLHQSHHRFIYPTLLDAFSGSYQDSICMIIVPLFVTSRIIHTNAWSYMVFGTIYANLLSLIHSEVDHTWDPFSSVLGIGTARDHRCHHKKLKKNYGHIFMFWDQLFGTYA